LALENQVRLILKIIQETYRLGVSSLPNFSISRGVGLLAQVNITIRHDLWQSCRNYFTTTGWI